MSALRLNGLEMGQLSDLLLEAFENRARLDQFLLFRLNQKANHIVGEGDDYATAVAKVVQRANAKLWWRDLLREARNAVPEDPGLLEFALTYGLSPVSVAANAAGTAPLDGPALEAKVKAAQSTYDISTWIAKLGEIEGRVCRIEYPANRARGTGFLVGADTVLTNYHVVRPVREGHVKPTAVVLRFDYKVGRDGVSTAAGTTYALGDPWLADFSPQSPFDTQLEPAGEPGHDTLDYAFLQVSGTPGEDPVGGATADPQPARRGWIEPSIDDPDFASQSAIFIVQHPDGKPMQVAIDTESVISVNKTGTRIRYSTTTEAGSSGSPCFGPDWEWVALHHAGDPLYYKTGAKPRFNQGIPVPAIRQQLVEGGKQALLGG